MEKLLENRVKKSIVVGGTIAALMLGAGCAKRPLEQQHSFLNDAFYDDNAPGANYDPFEERNKEINEFNTNHIYPSLDAISSFYGRLPDDLENLPREFSYNLGEPLRIACSITSGDPMKALKILGRTIINLAFVGFADVAGNEFGLKKEECTFATFMTTYFPDHDPLFLVLPGVGPTDTYRMFGRFMDPLNYLAGIQPARTGFDIANEMNATKETRETINKSTLDRYISLRNAYYNHYYLRNNKIDAEIANK